MEPWFCDVLLGSWKKIFYDFLKCFAHLDVAGVWQMLFHHGFMSKSKPPYGNLLRATEDAPLPVGMLVNGAALDSRPMPPKVRRLPGLELQ
jgi:hypothetical protein